MDQSIALQSGLTTKSFSSVEDFVVGKAQCDIVTLPQDEKAPYIAGFAVSKKGIDAALRLRYEVFNVELGEGLDESIRTGLDRDEFDEQMTHLVLLERKTGNVVGTYRIQTVQQAFAAKGLYSAQEYDMEGLKPYFDSAIELGRACLAEHARNFRAILTLWLGIGGFMNCFNQRYLFGCSSLTSQNPDEGWRALKTIRANGYLHQNIFLKASPVYSCGSPSRELDPELGDPLSLPKLFRTYLRLGAKVISEPAIDREFGTVDFLVLQDAHEVTFSQLDVVK
jgi:putative hemolysin